MIWVVAAAAGSYVKLTYDATYSVESLVSQCMEMKCSAYHYYEAVHEASLGWERIEVALHGVAENASLTQ